jgi:hypothetical protein
LYATVVLETPNQEHSSERTEHLIAAVLNRYYLEVTTAMKQTQRHLTWQVHCVVRHQRA